MHDLFVRLFILAGRFVPIVLFKKSEMYTALVHINVRSKKVYRLFLSYSYFGT